MRHLLSANDLDRGEVLGLLDRAEALRTGAPPAPPRTRWILGLLFFEPSTRTRVGFHAAALRLGGGVIELERPRQNERAGGLPESLEDTARVVSAYSDLLVVRHPERGAAARCAAVSAVPVVNGGDGDGEHPTQALIDLFAIRRSLGRLDGLRIGVVGDLAASRSARSLVRALRAFPPAELRLMHPEGCGLGGEDLGPLGRMTTSGGRLEPEGLDVLYAAGLPPGRDGRHGEAVRGGLRLTPESIRPLPAHAAVLCPLPRVDEIDGQVDGDGRARYFQQSADGLPVRLAVLEVLGGA